MNKGIEFGRRIGDTYLSNSICITFQITVLILVVITAVYTPAFAGPICDAANSGDVASDLIFCIRDRVEIGEIWVIALLIFAFILILRWMILSNNCPKCNRVQAMYRTDKKRWVEGFLGVEEQQEEWACKHCHALNWKNTGVRGRD